MEAAEKGIGVTTIDERVRILGANLSLWSQEGIDIRVAFTAPMDKGEMGSWCPIGLF